VANSLLYYIKKTYKVIAVIGFVVVFFVAYNTYVVDRSVINLRIALDQLAYAESTEDFQRIKPLLKVPFLNTVSQTELPAKEFLSLIAAQNIIDTGTDREQISDVKFFLKEVLKEKENQRGGILSALDRINELFIKPQTEPERQKLQAQARTLSAKVGTIIDPGARQEAYYRLENIYMQLSDLEMAQKVVKEIVSINPDSDIAEKARFNLGWAFNNAGEFQKAIVNFEEVSRESTNLTLAVTSEYQVADVLYKKGDYEAARDKYALLADKYPEYEGKAMAYYNAAQISFNELKDYRAALEYFYQYAIMQSGYISYFNLDEFNEAMSYLERLAEEDIDYLKRFRESIGGAKAVYLRRQGYALLRSKEYPQAIEKFSEALYVNPLDGMSIVGKGLGYYWEGLKERAQKTAVKALEVAEGPEANIDEDEAVFTNTAFIFINSNDAADAIALGEEFISKKMSEGEEIESAEFYYNLGYARILNGNIKKAIEYLEKSTGMEEEFALAYNNLGCAYWANKDYTKALRAFKIAIAKHEDYAEAHFNLGIAHYFLNRLDDAYKHFGNSLEANPEYMEAERYRKRIEEELQISSQGAQ